MTLQDTEDSDGDAVEKMIKSIILGGGRVLYFYHATLTSPSSNLNRGTLQRYRGHIMGHILKV